MKKVEIQQKKRVFDDFFKIDEAVVRFEKFNGEMSPPVRRLNFERGDAAAVLIFNKETQKVILVNQFRFPTYEKSGGWLIEVAAGMVDKDETPGECIRREVMEEIGYQLRTLTLISTFYTTPGGSSERIFLYYAEVTDSDRVSSGGGAETEHEDIQIVEFSLPELWKTLDAEKIMDAKTLVALMWLKNRVS
ncbi:MAG: NUDIX hydrolase [Candidatus Aminicenantes bacterium]|nr:MAG: NUDIX hydrolase [Candidatus Aminicenantes bacterium]